MAPPLALEANMSARMQIAAVIYTMVRNASDGGSGQMPAPPQHPARPLLRLLAINCGAGIAVAMLALCGILAISPPLRALILADHSPAVPLALLAGGLIVTFASVVMGSAIMRLGREHEAPPAGRGRHADRAEPVRVAGLRGERPFRSTVP